jgi:hypothetical protein
LLKNLVKFYPNTRNLNNLSDVGRLTKINSYLIRVFIFLNYQFFRRPTSENIYEQGQFLCYNRNMDIKELDKKQLILLTLLITFVVSIGTGIVTVSLMNQMPKSVPQTINNVIQRTIEKVTTVQAPVSVEDKKESDNVDISKDNAVSFIGNSDALVSIYLKSANTTIIPTGPVSTNEIIVSEPVSIGQGIIISDIGLILIDSNLINDKDFYKVVLNKIDFDVLILKRFSNGFTVLKITEKSSNENIPVEDINTPIKTN